MLKHEKRLMTIIAHVEIMFHEKYLSEKSGLRGSRTDLIMNHSFWEDLETGFNFLAKLMG